MQLPLLLNLLQNSMHFVKLIKTMQQKARTTQLSLLLNLFPALFLVGYLQNSVHFLRKTIQ